MSRSRRAAPLPVSFFRRPAEQVAPELLGALVVSRIGGERTAGRIVEAEAYLGEHDPASHGYRLRRNERNASLFGPPATWYVYLSYGMHWCANLVCLPAGVPAAVLVRALEPLEGLEAMRRRRGGVADRLLCAGPGRLCQALGITRELDGLPLSGAPVVVVPGDRPAAGEIVAAPRVGITLAADWPLRFLIRGSPWVSKKEGRVRGPAPSRR